MTTQPFAADGLMAVQWGDDLHQLGGPGQNGADVLTWLGTLIGADRQSEIAGKVARALAQPRHATPLIFLPYLAGERVPFWDADLRAAFLGLSREHGRGDLVWAALEGVAFLNRIVLGRAESAAGIAVDEVRLGGGAARIATWAQIKADVLDRTGRDGDGRRARRARRRDRGLRRLAHLRYARQGAATSGPRRAPLRAAPAHA